MDQVAECKFPKIFDNEEQFKRWEDAIRRNKRKNPVRNYSISDKKLIKILLEAIGDYHKDLFTFQDLDVVLNRTGARKVLCFLLGNGLIISISRHRKGLKYRRMFSEEDIPCILNEIGKNLKTLTEKQYAFLDHILEEGEQGAKYYRGKVKADYLILACFYYLMFRGAKERLVRIRYFREKKSYSNGSKPIFCDAPFSRAQAQALYISGKKKGLFDVVSKKKYSYYKFKPAFLNVENLMNVLDVKKGGKMDYEY